MKKQYLTTKSEVHRYTQNNNVLFNLQYNHLSVNLRDNLLNHNSNLRIELWRNIRNTIIGDVVNEIIKL